MAGTGSGCRSAAPALAPRFAFAVVEQAIDSGGFVRPFLGNPATGKHAEWLGIGIYTVRDGRITEGWFAEDIVGLLSQLDAIALPA